MTNAELFSDLNEALTCREFSCEPNLCRSEKKQVLKQDFIWLLAVLHIENDQRSYRLVWLLHKFLDTDGAQHKWATGSSWRNEVFTKFWIYFSYLSQSLSQGLLQAFLVKPFIGPSCTGPSCASPVNFEVSAQIALRSPVSFKNAPPVA